jgi:hypothetical protein
MGLHKHPPSNHHSSIQNQTSSMNGRDGLFFKNSKASTGHQSQKTELGKLANLNVGKENKTGLLEDILKQQNWNKIGTNQGRGGHSDVPTFSSGGSDGKSPSARESTYGSNNAGWTVVTPRRRSNPNLLSATAEGNGLVAKPSPPTTATTTTNVILTTEKPSLETYIAFCKAQKTSGFSVLSNNATFDSNHGTTSDHYNNNGNNTESSAKRNKKGKKKSSSNTSSPTSSNMQLNNNNNNSSNNSNAYLSSSLALTSQRQSRENLLNSSSSSSSSSSSTTDNLNTIKGNMQVYLQQTTNNVLSTVFTDSNPNQQQQDEDEDDNVPLIQFKKRDPTHAQNVFDNNNKNKINKNNNQSLKKIKQQRTLEYLQNNSSAQRWLSRASKVREARVGAFRHVVDQTLREDLGTGYTSTIGSTAAADFESDMHQSEWKYREERKRKHKLTKEDLEDEVPLGLRADHLKRAAMEEEEMVMSLSCLRQRQSKVWSNFVAMSGVVGLIITRKLPNNGTFSNVFIYLIAFL